MAFKTVLNIYVSLYFIALWTSATGQPEEIRFLFDLNRLEYGLKCPLDELRQTDFQDGTGKKFGNANSNLMSDRESSWGILIKHKRGRTVLFDLVDYVSKDKQRLKGESKIITNIMPGKRPKNSLWNTMTFNGK